MTTSAERLILGSLSPGLFAQHVLGQPLYPWQTTVSGSYVSGDSRTAVCCHRQSGKSELSITLLAYIATYQPGSTCLLVSQDQRGASEILDRMRQRLLAAVPGFVPASDSKTILDLRPTGGRVVTLPATGRAVRGWQRPALLVVDEAAHVDDEVWAAVTAVLAKSDHPRLLALSTPNPGDAASYFTRAMLDPGLADTWTRYRYSWTDTGLLDPDFVEAERLTMTPERFRAEYEADPEVALAGAPFRPDMMADAVADDLDAWDVQL